MTSKSDDWGESSSAGSDQTPDPAAADGPSSGKPADSAAANSGKASDGQPGGNDEDDGSTVLLPPANSDNTVILSRPVKPGTIKVPPTEEVKMPVSDGWDADPEPDKTDDSEDPDWARTLVLDPPDKPGTDSAVQHGIRTTVLDPPDGHTGPPARIDEDEDGDAAYRDTIVDPPGRAGGTRDEIPEDALKTLVDPVLPDDVPEDAMKTLVDPPSSDMLRALIKRMDADMVAGQANKAKDADKPGDTADAPLKSEKKSDGGADFFDNFTVSTAKKDDKPTAEKKSDGGADFFDNFSVSGDGGKKKEPAGDDDIFNFTVKADLKASHRGYGYENGEVEEEEDDEPAPLPDDLDAAATALIIEGGESNGDDDSAWLDFLPAGEMSRATNPLSTAAMLALGTEGATETADQRQLASLRDSQVASHGRQWDAPAPSPHELETVTEWDVSNPGAGLDQEITRALGSAPPPPPPPRVAPLEESRPLPTFGYETTIGINIYDDAPAFIMERVTPRTRVLALSAVAPGLDNRPVNISAGLVLELEAPAWVPEPPRATAMASEQLKHGDHTSAVDDDAHGGPPDYDPLADDTTVTGELPPGWRAIIQNLRSQGHETFVGNDPPPGTSGKTGKTGQTGARQADTTWHENPLRRITSAMNIPTMGGGNGHGQAATTNGDGNADDDATLHDNDDATLHDPLDGMAGATTITDVGDDLRRVLEATDPSLEAETTGVIHVLPPVSTPPSAADFPDAAPDDSVTRAVNLSPTTILPIEEIWWESSPGDIVGNEASDGSDGAMKELESSSILLATDFMAPSATQVLREVQAVTSGVTDRYAQLEREAEVLRERYQLLLDSYERIRGAVRLAKAYQQQMLPEAPHDVPGLECGVLYKPAEHVSGDFYDFLPIGKTRYAITIGDISGHGIAPALIMTVCRKVLHLYLDSGLGPGDAMKRANKAICRDLPAATFITAIACVVDMQARTLTIARAGHPPPLVFNPRSRGAMPIEPNPRGMALGMDPGPIFDRTLTEETIDLQPNDLIVLYSDGVTELSDKKGEQFGRERFTNIIREFGYGTVPFCSRGAPAATRTTTSRLSCRACCRSHRRRRC